MEPLYHMCEKVSGEQWLSSFSLRAAAVPASCSRCRPLYKRAPTALLNKTILLSSFRTCLKILHSTLSFSLHLSWSPLPQAAWEQCLASGTPYTPPTYAQDGFIHLTADPALLLQVANHFYTDSKGDWVVLVIAPERLAAEVKYEPAAPVGDKGSDGLHDKGEEGPLFPHLYGALNTNSVTALLPMTRDAEGKFLGIEGL
jgi:uncharacterized protein (DUF952 family)